VVIGEDGREAGIDHRCCGRGVRMADAGVSVTLDFRFSVALVVRVREARAGAWR